jgi:hypothetical protein
LHLKRFPDINRATQTNQEARKNMSEAEWVDQLLGAAQVSRDFVTQTGGLPEIVRASHDLMEAIRQTRNEVEAATFDERFPRRASDYFREMSKGRAFPQHVQAAVEAEGEAGHKRAALLAALKEAEGMVHTVIHFLVEIRTDMKCSQEKIQ